MVHEIPMISLGSAVPNAENYCLLHSRNGTVHLIIQTNLADNKCTVIYVSCLILRLQFWSREIGLWSGNLH